MWYNIYNAKPTRLIGEVGNAKPNFRKFPLDTKPKADQSPALAGAGGGGSKPPPYGCDWMRYNICKGGGGKASP